MKKHSFKKIMSFLLVAVMLSSIAAMAIPASAAVETPINLVPNVDNWVNGVRIRFETTGTDTYAKIENGKLSVRMNEGDLLWFPDLTVKDETTTISYEMTIEKDDILPYVVTCIEPKGTEKYMCAQTFGGWGKWVCARLPWSTTESEIVKDDGPGETWYKNTADNSTTLPGSAILKTGNVLNTTTVFTMGTTQLRPVTTFQESDSTEPYIHTFKDYDSVNPYGSFGIAARNQLIFSLENVVATNINGNNGNYSENFDVIDSYSGPIINMRQAGTTVEFDSGIAFIDFKFMVHETVSADTEFVVKKNNEVVDRKAVSTFTAVDGVYTYSTHFMTVDYADVLTLCLEKGGTVLADSTYEIDYGAQYKDFVENPPPTTSSTLINVVYSENFETALVLQPGENIVNGKVWTYVKNSTDGSAVIKNGRLYFVGSNNDMIIFEDLNVDQVSYGFEYSLTYLETPADDIWDNWTAWFGSFYHLSEADSSGNRFAYIASITPNDVYMLQGIFGSEGAFTATPDLADHATFQNSPSNPTQPGELYYWNGRLGNGVPMTVKSFVGVSGYGHGGIGMSGYNATGSHQVSANLPGGNNGVPSMDKRVGKLGFVCGESRVSVIVDDLVIKTKGKSVTVDGESTQIPADGEMNVSALQKADKKLIYASVDNALKYAGDTFTATRLTQINTTQISFNTKKLVADGQTGLKWVTEINKADYEKLLTDSNISKVEVGTVVVTTANAKDGITLENAQSNIAGTATLNGDVYSFEGILAIDKAARDTSYSGIGYVKVTMTDGKEIVVYSDYIARNHAYALSDLVEEFTDDETETGNNAGADTGSNDATSETQGTNEEEKGCGSSVAGIGIVLAVTGMAAFAVTRKSKENEI